MRLFFSYAHKDDEYREQLVTSLAMLRRRGFISLWHDRNITAGAVWADVVDQEMELANVIVLLVSPDFLASKYCYDVEMSRAMQRHEEGTARVIPILVRWSADWDQAPFGKLQALPSDGRPVRAWGDPDEAWVNIAQGIRRAVEDLRQQRP
jgi:hypothetical protein